MCQHLIGKNIKYYGVDHVIWGTDCLWWGSPQWVIDAFKRFQISDELCDKFGYKKVTKEDKAKIFGLNAAKIYGVDVKEKRNAVPKDTLSQLKVAYLEEGGKPDNAAHGWVRGRLTPPCRIPAVRLNVASDGCRRRPGSASGDGAGGRHTAGRARRRFGRQAHEEGSRWGSDHVDAPLPDYATGDECLFCHRDRFGADWEKNAHQMTIRRIDTAPVPMAALKATPATGSFAEQVEFVLGERRQVRFLKRTGECGRLALLTALAPPPPGTRSRRVHGKLIDLDNVHWDQQTFAKKCAGCHTTAVDPKTHAFSATSLDCFTCHGVVEQKHADTKSVYLGRGRHDGPQVALSICAQCHLRTASRGARASPIRRTSSRETTSFAISR